MSITDDDYFKDVTSQIGEDDLIKAGYRKPKNKLPVDEFLEKQREIESENGAEIEGVDLSKIEQVQERIAEISEHHHISVEKSGIVMGPPKPISKKTLKGDLTNVAVPVPMNYHEGGLFNNEEERRKFHKSKSDTDIPSLSADSDMTKNPFVTKAMTDDELTLKKAKIAGDDMIIARGPNNRHGHAGFYSAVFKAGKFGKYPSADDEIIYDPNDIDDNADQLGDDKLKQLNDDIKAINNSLFSKDVDGKKIISSGGSFGDDVIKTIKECEDDTASDDKAEVQEVDESDGESDEGAETETEDDEEEDSGSESDDEEEEYAWYNPLKYVNWLVWG